MRLCYRLLACTCDCPVRAYIKGYSRRYGALDFGTNPSGEYELTAAIPACHFVTVRFVDGVVRAFERYCCVRVLERLFARLTNRAIDFETWSSTPAHS